MGSGAKAITDRGGHRAVRVNADRYDVEHHRLLDRGELEHGTLQKQNPAGRTVRGRVEVRRAQLARHPVKIPEPWFCWGVGGLCAYMRVVHGAVKQFIAFL